MAMSLAADPSRILCNPSDVPKRNTLEHAVPRFSWGDHDNQMTAAPNNAGLRSEFPLFMSEPSEPSRRFA
jgi:hypothetical protein